MEKKLTEDLLEKAKQAETPKELADNVLEDVAGGYILRIADNGNDSSLRAAGCVRVCGKGSDDFSTLIEAARSKKCNDDKEI